MLASCQRQQERRAWERSSAARRSSPSPRAGDCIVGSPLGASGTGKSPSRRAERCSAAFLTRRLRLLAHVALGTGEMEQEWSQEPHHVLPVRAQSCLGDV